MLLLKNIFRIMSVIEGNYSWKASGKSASEAHLPPNTATQIASEKNWNCDKSA
jgi:hypothetical protein